MTTLDMLQGIKDWVLGKLADEREEVRAALVPLSACAVRGNLWESLLTWQDDFMWPGENTADLEFLNSYTSAIGWTGEVRWVDGAKWPKE